MKPKKQPRRRPQEGYAALIVRYALLAVAALFFLTPLFWMLSASVKTLQDIYTFPPVWIPTEPRFANYVDAWNAAPFGRFYLNTIITTVGGVSLELINAVLTAYALVFLRFPGRNLVFIALLAALMIPIHVTILPNYLTVAALGWVNTYQGIILPGAAVAFGAFLLRQHFLTIPTEIIEAAKLDGANHLQVLWYVVVPVSKPVIVTVALISVVGKWNDFLWPLIVTNSTDMRVLPVGLAFLFDQEGTNQWGIIMAATIFVIVPVLLLFLRWQKHIISGLTAGSTKG
jgi:sn-glycerol 3-phosphate transport system permease protein